MIRKSSIPRLNKICNDNSYFQINTLTFFDLYNEIQKSVDDRHYAFSVFQDFAKAFDTVNRSILLK